MANGGLIFIRGKTGVENRVWTQHHRTGIWHHRYGGWLVEVEFERAPAAWVAKIYRHDHLIGDLEFVKDSRFDGMSQDEKMDIILHHAGIVFDGILGIWTELIND